MQNKWVLENQSVEDIKKRIHLFKTDVAALGTIPPRDFISELSTRIERMMGDLEAVPFSTEDAALDSETRLSLYTEIRFCLSEISLLAGHIRNAEKIARTIRDEFKFATEHTISTHNPAQSILNVNELNIKNYSQTHFLNIKIAGANVWSAIRDRNQAFESLPGLHLISSPQGNHAHLLHNSLVHLLKSTDSDLLDAIDRGQLALEGEVGNLIIQRLKEIRSKGNIYDARKGPLDSLRRREAKLAATIINRNMGTATGEGLFKCDFDALYIELTKLALHAELHPESKTVWLGTARSVIAMVETNNEIGTYLNCDDHKWTWHLNRLWLQAALSMGFKLELIEQHYPSIEDALLAGDGGARFVQELLKQVREDANDTSQYNGYDAPTATAQEILAALDTRCMLRKGSNNRICLMQAPVLDDTLHKKGSNRSNNPLYHSWESGFRAPVSPFKYSGTQFSPPKESPQLRQAKAKTNYLSFETGEGDQNSPTDVTMLDRLSPIIN